MLPCFSGGSPEQVSRLALHWRPYQFAPKSACIRLSSDDTFASQKNSSSKLQKKYLPFEPYAIFEVLLNLLGFGGFYELLVGPACSIFFIKTTFCE